MKRILFIFTTFILATAVQGQMLSISDHDLIQTSESIIRGKVISNEAKWVNNGKYIYTFTKIKVNEIYSGKESKDSVITIVAPGGYDPEKDLGMRVSHQALFEEGEDVVVFLVIAQGESDAIDYTFLENDPTISKNLMRVNGYFQGKRKIFEDRISRKLMILKSNEDRIIELKVHNQQLVQEINHLH